MRAKDIKPGMIVAIGARPGDQWARRAVVLGPREWNDVSMRWDRFSRFVRTAKPDAKTGYPLAVEDTRHDGPARWVPQVATSKRILAPWDDHLVQVEDIKRQRAEASEQHRIETDQRIARARSIDERAKALGVTVTSSYSDSTVTATADAIEQLLKLAEAPR